VTANTQRLRIFPSKARANIEDAAGLFRTGLLRPAPRSSRKPAGIRRVAVGRFHIEVPGAEAGQQLDTEHVCEPEDRRRISVSRSCADWRRALP
jgi:hypothetical protein